MLYFIFFPQEAPLAAAGFTGMSHIPVIFNERWEYQKTASWYLRERASGSAFNNDENARCFPVKKSLETYARSLIDFREWADWIKRPWQNIQYKQDLIDGYQQQMATGTWSAGKEKNPLKPRTINRRMDEACYFLQWAARRQLRGPFKILTYQTFRRTSYTKIRKPQLLICRAGRVRPDPIELRIPSDQEIIHWLNCVKIKKGLTVALMCELIIKTAIRREECAQWRTFTLPEDSTQWDRTARNVVVKIEYGTKGPKRKNARSDEVGPTRFVTLPTELAERLHYYREYIRPKIRMKYINDAKSPEQRRRRLYHKEERLFLSEYNGTPITGETLWKGWTSVNVKPYEGWSPHLGRHYWACRTLFDQYRQHQQLLAEGVVTTSDWITANGNSDLLLIITPQLGHVDEKTTRSYLVWLQRMALQADHSVQWINYLEELLVPTLDFNG